FFFVLASSEISTAIVGTGSLFNLEHNLEMAQRKPLPASVASTLRSSWEKAGADWLGLI
ncbi:MAG: hypothetical protein HKM06_04980, partial [Spirochaetales bacterium]|nr:hypothetical protein [Spirochaetales bacterium]